MRRDVAGSKRGGKEGKCSGRGKKVEQRGRSRRWSVHKRTGSKEEEWNKVEMLREVQEVGRRDEERR